MNLTGWPLALVYVTALVIAGAVMMIAILFAPQTALAGAVAIAAGIVGGVFGSVTTGSAQARLRQSDVEILNQAKVLLQQIGHGTRPPGSAPIGERQDTLPMSMTMPLPVAEPVPVRKREEETTDPGPGRSRR